MTTVYQIVGKDYLTLTTNAGEAIHAAGDPSKRVYKLQFYPPWVEKASMLWPCVHYTHRFHDIPLEEVKLFGGRSLVPVPVGKFSSVSINMILAIRFTTEVAERVSARGSETFLLVP